MSDRLRQRANKRNKNRVGRLPTSEQNWKIIRSDEVRRRIGKGYVKFLAAFKRLMHIFKKKHVTLHFQQVSAHVGAQLREVSYLTVPFSTQQLAVNTCP